MYPQVWAALLGCCVTDKQQAYVNNGPTPSLLNSVNVDRMLQDANFDCSSTGFALQAMDSSHVSLIHMQV